MPLPAPVGHDHPGEIICPGCGDDPARDWLEVSPELQAVRGVHETAQRPQTSALHAGQAPQRHPGAAQTTPVCAARAMPRALRKTALATQPLAGRSPALGRPA